MTDTKPVIRVVWIIPAMLQTASEGNAEVAVDLQNPSYHEAVKQLTTLYPGIAEHFEDETFKPRSYISIFHNAEQLTDYSTDSSIRDRDELLIVPALAGG